MRDTTRTRGVRRVLALAILVLTAALAGSASATPPELADHPLLQPIDAQNWVDQAELTWDAYTPIRPDSWNDTTGSDGSVNQYRTAVILLEFQDQPMLITQPPGSHPFGNPQAGWTPVAREDAADWYYDYYAVPNEFNGGQTLHGYWMEDTHGKIGVDVEVFGPYTLPGKLHEYGIPDGSFNAPREAYCPQGDSCTKNLRTDGGALWRADIGCASGLCGFDNGFYVTAGHDESSTWQEFGEMMFQTRDDIPDAFGPPRNPDGSAPLNQLGQPMPNWADTRYVDWTSWRSAANHWPNAGGGTSTQAESSGLSVFAHEFSHLRGLPDNYNNPFADVDRNYTGYWEMMSRGTFNGPGGTHNRWQVPNAGGSGLGPHHLLEYKDRLGVLAPTEKVTLARDTLHTQGVGVVELKARESVPAGELAGLTVTLGTGDLAGSCANQGFTPETIFYCPNRNNSTVPYLRYHMEVVDRVGNDSFAPGHGVLLTKSRNGGLPSTWMIDPNPQNIGMIDFYRPDGTPVAVVRGDPRQLNDASFHAGTRSGSAYEYVDTFNDLHFYVLSTRRGGDDVLRYRVAVRRTGEGDPFARGVGLGSPSKQGQRPGFLATCSFPLTNTGQAGTGMFDSDVYRVSAASSEDGWQVSLPNALAAAKAGATVQVPVHVLRDNKADDKSTRTIVTLTATSETDPTKSATRTCAVHVKDTTPN